jgi:hypothetical protein
MKSKIGLALYLWRNIPVVLFFAFLLSECYDPEEFAKPGPPPFPCENFLSMDSIDAAERRSCLPIDCAKCKYIVGDDVFSVDGTALNFKPGDFICFEGGQRNRQTTLRFVNIHGSPGNPIVILNCGGRSTVRVPDGAPFNVKFERSSYFRVTGTGSWEEYGIELSGSTLGLTLDKLSTNFEIDHVEVSKAAFAGIMAKTDPTCDSASFRGNFVMRDISIHDNFIHNVGGEGFYIGNSFYTDGIQLDTCGFLPPHTIEGVKVFNNLTQQTGREGIQLGCAVVGAEVYNNRVENYGLDDLPGQDNGIQIGDGTGGLCYNNSIMNGKGSGIIVLGIGGNVVFNNLIVRPDGYGIFCNDRNAVGNFKIVNNTIVQPKDDGIRFYTSGLLDNAVVNNLIVAPGSYGNPDYKNLTDAFLFVRDTANLLYQSNNLFLVGIELARFKNPAKMDFDLNYQSPAKNTGLDASIYGVTFDFLMHVRPIQEIYDIGAFESTSKR